VAQRAGGPHAQTDHVVARHAGGVDQLLDDLGHVFDDRSGTAAGPRFPPRLVGDFALLADQRPDDVGAAEVHPDRQSFTHECHSIRIARTGRTPAAKRLSPPS
jgi:hypothetical protein